MEQPNIGGCRRRRRHMPSRPPTRPLGQVFLILIQFFENNWPNNRLTSPPYGRAPHLDLPPVNIVLLPQKQKIYQYRKYMSEGRWEQVSALSAIH